MRIWTWGLVALLLLSVGDPRGLLAQDSSELWDLAIFERPPHLLQVEDAPERSQLLVSRLRTDATVGLANATFRQKAGSLWLQANLEYQAFLSAASEADRRDTGAAAAQRVRQFREVMFGASPADVTAEWTETLIFANSIEGTVQPYVPADVASADDLVRGLLFDLLNPAEGQGSTATTTIQDLTSGSIKRIERLAMSAIAARVQAANVLQLTYGQNPDRVRTHFEQGEIERKILGRSKDSPEVYRRDVDWQNILDLVALISPKGGSDVGIVGKYQELADFTQLPDGVLAAADPEFESSYPESPNWRDPPPAIKAIDLRYGSGVNEKDQLALTKLMTDGNALAQCLKTAIKIDIDKREKKLPYALEFPAGFMLDAAKLEFEIDSPPDACSVPHAQSAGATKADQRLVELKVLLDRMKTDGKDKKALPDPVEADLAIVYSLTTIRNGKPTPEQDAKSKLTDWTYEWAAKYLHVPHDPTDTNPAAPKAGSAKQGPPGAPGSPPASGRTTNPPAASPPERTGQARRKHPSAVAGLLASLPLNAVALTGAQSRAAPEPPQPLTEPQVFARLVEAENLMASGGSTLRSGQRARLQELEKDLRSALSDTKLADHQKKIVAAVSDNISRYSSQSHVKILNDKLDGFAKSVGEGYEHLDAKIKTADKLVKDSANSIAAAYSFVIGLHPQITATHVSANEWFGGALQGVSRARLRDDFTQLQRPAREFALSKDRRDFISALGSAGRPGELQPRPSAPAIDQLQWMDGQIVWWDGQIKAAQSRLSGVVRLAPADRGYLAKHADVIDFAPGIENEGKRPTKDQMRRLRAAWSELRNYMGVSP